MSETEGLAQLAERAAQLIAERGHCKFLLVSDEGHLCLAGAIMAAQAESEGRLDVARTPNLFDGRDQFIWPAWRDREAPYRNIRKVLSAADEVVGRETDYSGTYLEDSAIDFNNDSGTSAEDVILVLKQAAEALRAGS